VTAVQATLARHPVAAYGALALAITWGCWLPLAVAGLVVRPGLWPSHAPGLLGPALAAVIVTAILIGRRGLRELGRSLLRWRIGLGSWLVVLSPLALFAVVSAATGRLPAWSDLGEMNGFPRVPPPLLWSILVVVNGFGEEVGWRGFAFSRFRERHGWLAASLLVAPLWAVWHVPSFFVLETYRGFGAGELVGFSVGILCGAVTFGWLYERSRRSLLAVAVWHATFNLFTATKAARGPLAAVETTAVIVLALALVAHELWRGRHELRAAGQLP